MNTTRKFTQAILSLIMIFSMLLSLVQTQPVAAQSNDPDGAFHSENSFILPSIAAAAGGIRAQDPDPTETPTPLPTETTPPTEEPILPDAVIPTGTPTPIPSFAVPTQSSESARPEKRPMAFSGTTRYVSPSGTAMSGCTSSSNPCSKIQYAISSSANGDIIKVAEGTYSGKAPNSNPNVVVLSKGVLLSGGWQSNFSSQTGISTIDGQNVNNGILVTAGEDSAVDRFLIENCTSQDGGAIYYYVNGSDFTLTNSTLRNNTAGNRGGGIFKGLYGTLRVINSTISGNTANNGGGIYLDDGLLYIDYSTIAYNTATSAGGGVFNNHAIVLAPRSSILAQNNSTASPDCKGSMSSDYNIIGSTAGCALTSGVHDQTNINPGIDSALTGTIPVHALLEDSPAIDTGNPATCTTKAANVDERGVARPQAGGCDSGAFELEAPGVPAAITYVSGGSQQRQLHQAFLDPFVARVTDGNGEPLSGVSVTFTAPASGASGTFASNGEAAETVTTDINGHAVSSVFTANWMAGSYTVYASSGVMSKASYALENLYIPGVPQNITVTGGNNQGASPNTAFTNPFVVLVKDGDGALGGVDVIFTAPVSGASGTFGNGTITETVPTDANGYATASVFTANDTSGTYTIAVSVSGYALSASITATNMGNRYVKTAADGGADVGNCLSVATACASINYAISRAFPGETVQIASGTYTADGSPVALINKNVMLSAGWNVDFTAQSGYSIIDGQGTQIGIKVEMARTVVVERVTIQNGTAGVYNDWGILTLNNSTLSGNTGGGLYQENGASTINNTTISGNTASNGGGIRRMSGTVILKNTIVAGNTATTGRDCSGVISSAGYNLIGSTSGCTFNPTTGDRTNVNAFLGPFIGYYPLQAGSPAIDAGNPAEPGSGGDACLATDARGITRPVGAACDIGAYEYTVPGSTTSLLIIGGDGQQVPPGLSLTDPLKVVALDHQGNLVPGRAVVFTAPESGPSGIFADTGTWTTTVTTDASGVATAPTYTANAVMGLYTLVVSTSGAPSVNFSVRNSIWFVATTGSDTNDCVSPSTPCATLQAAVDKAIAGGTIQVASGTYRSSAVEILKKLTLSGGWDGTFTVQNETSIIDGGGIVIDSNKVVTIEHFTIQNVHGNPGIASTGVLTLNNSIIRNNTITSVGYGAGLNLSGGETVINNTEIIGNSSVTDGGAIHASNVQLTINNSSIENNQGVGIYVSAGSVFSLNNTTVAHNSGSGLSLGSNGLYTLNNAIIAHNKQHGINFASFGASGSLTISGSEVTNNSKNGITLGSGTSLDLKNTTVAKNLENGVYVNSGASLTARNATIAYNGGTGLDAVGGANVIVRNTILANNTAKDCRGMIDTDHSLISKIDGWTGCSLHNISGNPQVNVDPLLSEVLVGNPGYLIPAYNSPVIDMGNPATCLAVDQRGLSRPQGEGCDLGAYEVQVLHVTTTEDTNDGACDSDCSLREAMTSATDGQRIYFSIDGTIMLGSPLPVIDRPLIIKGWQHSVVVDGGGSNRIFEIASTGDLSFSQLTLQHGSSSSACSGSISASCGGTIHNAGKLEITKTAFSSSTAELGGTIYNAGELQIDHSTFTGSSAELGGNIYNTGALVINNSTFSGSATQQGGALYNAGNLEVTNSTFSGSSAQLGGAIFTESGPTAINSSTFFGNSATSGGAIYNAGNTLELRSSTLSGNSATQGANLYNTGTLTFTSNILANTTSNDCYNQEGSGIVYINEQNLVELNAPAPNHCGTPAFSEDPHLASSLADNGGPTQTLALLFPSIALDRGTACPAQDQRGHRRTERFGCDLGAYEYEMQGSDIDLGVPKPLSPVNHYKTFDATPTFEWMAVNDAVLYEIQFALDSDFNSIRLWYFTEDPTVTLPTLLENRVYYWRVQAYNAAHLSSYWSTTRSFTIHTSSPVLKFPLNNASLRSVPTFRWNTVTGAARYQFEIDNNADFSSPLLSVVQRATYRKPSGPLRGTYYWRVRAQDAAGNWTAWSDVFTVHIFSPSLR